MILYLRDTKANTQLWTWFKIHDWQAFKFQLRKYEKQQKTMFSRRSLNRWKTNGQNWERSPRNSNHVLIDVSSWVPRVVASCVGQRWLFPLHLESKYWQKSTKDTWYCSHENSSQECVCGQTLTENLKVVYVSAMTITEIQEVPQQPQYIHGNNQDIGGNVCIYWIFWWFNVTNVSWCTN